MHVETESDNRFIDLASPLYKNRIIAYFNRFGDKSTKLASPWTIHRTLINFVASIVHFVLILVPEYNKSSQFTC